MNKKNIEAILPLTSLQLGFLWHSVAGKVDRSAGLVQTRCQLVGTLRRDLFEQAWQQTVDHHQQLRATVHWRNVKQPVSVIHRQASADIQYLDWRLRAADEKSIDCFLTEDLQSGLVFEQAPVMRMTLIQTDEGVHELVWTCHHLLLDGWSSGLVLDEIFRRYDALAGNTVFSEVRTPTLASYLKWLSARELEPAKQYWTNLLAGFNPPVGLPAVGSPVGHESTLSPAETSALTSFIRESRTTLNVCLQSAWAIVLARLYGDDDVVFGATVSGRQIDFDRADQMIGMFINVLPVRVNLARDQTIDSLLQGVQAQSFKSLPHAFADTAQIQVWSQCPGKLFDSLIVVENQPTGRAPVSIDIKNRRSGIVSAYGITIVAQPGDQLSLSLSAGDSLIASGHGTLVLEAMRSVLVQFSTAGSHLVGDVSPGSVPSLRLSPAPALLERSSIDAKADAIPTSLLEEKIRRIWESTLGVEPIAPSDSFFELGGTSIQALVMFNRLESEIGVSLPTTALLQHSTVASLVRLIGQDETVNQFADVVAIQTNGDKPPLFIPDTATDLLIYRHLAKELGPSQPIYGFRARELGSLPLAELAARLTAQLRALQPRGPYRLAGMSGGGPLAWLMAQHLEEQGCKVGLLVLFDCLGPEYPRLQSPMRRVASCLRSAGRVLLRKVTHPDQDKLLVMAEPLSQQAAEQVGTDSEQRWASTKRAQALALAVTRSRSIGEKIANLVVLASLKIPSQSNRLAWTTFMQGLWLQDREAGNTTTDEAVLFAGRIHAHLYDDLLPFKGRIEFFKAEQRPPTTLDDRLVGWQPLIAGEFVVHLSTGDHVSLLQPPQVAEVARTLASALARSQSQD